MKIYISTDLEGVTGIYRWEQVSPRYVAFKDSVKLLMGDIAAVAEGLKEAGVKEIYASDGHCGGNNFMAEYMVSGVKYISGRNKGTTLDNTFDGYILLGYHSMNGTPGGLLHHTQNDTPELKYWYDGIERGEIFQSGVIAGNYDVPVMLITGDEAACEEARSTFGQNLPAVAVKKGLNREAAIIIAPDDTRPMLVEGAIKAVKMLPELKPYKVKFPMKLKVRRIATDVKTSDNPYYIDIEGEVRDIKDIYTGGQKLF